MKVEILIHPSFNKRGGCSVCGSVCFVHRGFNQRMNIEMFFCDSCAATMIYSGRADWM